MFGNIMTKVADYGFEDAITKKMDSMFGDDK
jgi:hypothetical protein